MIFTELLGAGLNLLGGMGGASEADKAARQQRRMMKEMSQIQFNPYSLSGPGGFGVSFQDGQAQYNLGSFNPFYNMLGQLGMGGVQQGQNYQGLAANQLNTGFGPMAQQLAQQGFGLASGLAGSGFQQGLQGNLFGAANVNALEAGRGFNDLRDSTLAQLRAAAAPEEERAYGTHMTGLFNKGMLGSTGGALQTEAFAKGLAQADISRNLAATNLAQSQQAQASNIASQLSAAGGNVAGLESRLLNEAFGRFADTSGVANDLNQFLFNRGTSLFNQGMAANAGQQGFFDLFNSMATQGGNLGAQAANTRVAALGGAGQIASNPLPTGNDIRNSFLSSLGTNLGGAGGLRDAFSGLFGGGGGSASSAPISFTPAGSFGGGYNPFASMNFGV